MNWNEVADEIMHRLTKSEKEAFEDLILRYGSAEDAIINLVRKAVNPDLISMTDIELCLQKALKIGAYVNAMGSPNANNYGYQVANEIAKEALSENPENDNANPFKSMMKQMSEMIWQSVMAEIQQKIASSLNIPITGSNNNNNKHNDTNNEVFHGDE